MYAELVGVETSVVPLETMIVVMLVLPIHFKLKHRHDPPETAKKFRQPHIRFQQHPHEVTPEQTDCKVIAETFQPSTLECLAD
jgi:hypothetical protein